MKRSTTRRAPRPPRRGSRGLSILEMMVAFSILGIGILGITAAQLAAIKLSSDSRIHTEAMLLGEEQLEVFRPMSGADVVALAGTTVDPSNPIDPDLFDATTMALNRSWTIAADTPEVGMITITVDTSWTNSLGNISSTSVQSLKAEL